MSYIYSFTIPNLKYMGHLHDYISAIPSIPSKFELYVEVTVDVVFEEELSADSVAILNQYISVYVPPIILYEIDHMEVVNILKSSVDTVGYFTFATNYWISETKLSNGGDVSLGYIMIASNILPDALKAGEIQGSAGYQIRVYDVLNNNIITESDVLSNSHLQIVKLESLQNLPLTDTLIEFQCKIIGVGTCSLKSVNYVFYKCIQ